MARHENLSQTPASLVAEIERAGIRNERILDAFRRVPRHVFVGEHAKVEDVYRDQPIPIRSSSGSLLSCSTQPSLMAKMLDAVQIEHGMRVLEVGTGTGYNAAVISELVQPVGTLVTVEVNEPVANRAEKLLRKWAPHCTVITGDANNVIDGNGRFDAFIVTAGSSHIPTNWCLALKDGARLCIPLRLQSHLDIQVVIVLQRVGRSLLSNRVFAGSFIPLSGPGQEPGRNWLKATIGGDSLLVRGDGKVRSSLTNRRQELPVEKEMFADPVAADGLLPYLVVAHHGKETVEVYRDSELLPSLGIIRGRSSAYLILDRRNLVGIQGCGIAFRELRRLVEQWRQDGEPNATSIDVHVSFPRDSAFDVLSIQIGSASIRRKTRQYAGASGVVP